MTEDDGDTMFDIMNKRMIELENRLIKTENKNKKLTSVINKMIKDKQLVKSIIFFFIIYIKKMNNITKKSRRCNFEYEIESFF